MEERRRNTRSPLEARLMIKRLDGEELDEVDIEVTDLSKTGVGFTCGKALTIGAVYEAFLTIWTKEVLHAFVEIARIEKEADVFNYGGIFVGMSEMDAARIEVYQTVVEHS